MMPWQASMPVAATMRQLGISSLDCSASEPVTEAQLSGMRAQAGTTYMPVDSCSCTRRVKDG